MQPDLLLCPSHGTPTDLPAMSWPQAGATHRQGAERGQRVIRHPLHEVPPTGRASDAAFIVPVSWVCSSSSGRGHSSPAPCGSSRPARESSAFVAILLRTRPGRCDSPWEDVGWKIRRARDPASWSACATRGTSGLGPSSWTFTHRWSTGWLGSGAPGGRRGRPGPGRLPRRGPSDRPVRPGPGPRLVPWLALPRRANLTINALAAQARQPRGSGDTDVMRLLEEQPAPSPEASADFRRRVPTPAVRLGRRADAR